MDFIYADHGDLAAIFAQVLSEEALWCDEQNLDLLIFDGLENGLLGWETLLRVDACTWHEGGELA